MHRLRLLYALFFSFLITTAFRSSAQSTNLDFGSWFETTGGVATAWLPALSEAHTLSRNGHNLQLGSVFCASALIRARSEK
jgi:hypothetical protein